MSTCRDAFKNLNIAINQGAISISPCCLVPTVKTKSINFQDNQYLLQIRHRWSESDFPPECASCQELESKGYTSRRQGANNWYKDHGHDNNQVELVRLDYWVGDTCNLRCAICGPNFSSAWKQELNVSPKLKQSVSNQFWKQIDLKRLRFVHFNGGEPLLSKQHVEFLHALPNKNLIHLNYNTNGTILPSDELQNLWQQFRLVQLDFSIDDIDQRFEYQRYPANWSEVKKNLQWFIETAPHNCMFAVNTSVGLLNHANLPNLTAWLKENFYVSRFTDPVEHRQQLVQGLFELEGFQQRRAQIVRFLDACDRRRGTDWRKTFPELPAMLD